VGSRNAYRQKKSASDRSRKGHDRTAKRNHAMIIVGREAGRLSRRRLSKYVWTVRHRACQRGEGVRNRRERNQEKHENDLIYEQNVETVETDFTKRAGLRKKKKTPKRNHPINRESRPVIQHGPDARKRESLIWVTVAHPWREDDQ